ncbi:DUF4917 family protein [Shimia sp. CNT1-13L.2]|uniref:DUF4917 family protein n=1 Tax=Shimia sp. CNT1-13L.2 TaxID=2959663 RepID=UPI0020CFA303|nr:DUF4917 family protein [Shimia sp. CNT1-13L.2]MCP9480334.1 DUF4917 family protein [Shimia sp. CNT1-13L.2]
MGILTFQQALDHSSEYKKRHLLLGNGFSIACKPEIFSYGSLFNNADFSANPNLPKVFDALGTTDFEVAIRALENASAISGIYVSDSHDPSADMLRDAQALKEILISTVTRNHPDGPFDVEEEQFLNCRNFLSNFIGPEINGHVYTLNYDLLLYWTLMHSEFSDGSKVELRTVDGFGDDDPSHKEDYVTWQGEGSRMHSNVFFLHGALHLFDGGRELQKFTWIRKDERLKEQSWEAMNSGRLPLFVAEGTTSQKATKIQHHAYLFQCLKSFRACVDTIKTCIFVHGHSLADNDGHIFREIARGRCQRIYVSLHGNPSSEPNREIMAKAQALAAARSSGYTLNAHFYDAESAHVWG